MENQAQDGGKPEIAAHQSDVSAAEPQVATAAEPTPPDTNLQHQPPAAEGTTPPDGAGGKPAPTAQEKLDAINAAIHGQSGQEAPPRTTEELQAEVQQLMLTVGGTYLEMKFQERSLEQLVLRSYALNNEVGRRQQVDQAVEAEKIQKAQDKRERKSAAAQATVAQGEELASPKPDQS